MLSWLTNPLLRVALVFAPGIYFGFELDFDSSQLERCWLLGFGLFMFFNLGLGILPSERSLASGTRRNSWTGFIRILDTTCSSSRILNPFIGTLGMTLLFTAGMLRTQWKPYQYDPIVAMAQYYQARIIKPPEAPNQRLILQLEWVSTADSIHYTDDKIVCWLSAFDKSEEVSSQWIPGARLIIKGAPDAIRSPSNPKELNYAQLMSRQNVFWQHWVSSTDVISIMPHQQARLNNRLATTREYLRGVLTDHLPTGPAQAISLAMLLGDRQALTAHIKSIFADSGAIHILAVSGLHLGILYWILLKLFGRLRRHARLKWIFAMICIMILWAYTIITGMSPSTQRAAVMFSFLLLSNALNLRSISGNSLGAAAIIILYLDPYQLYSVGFQLSFSALSGILYLQPILLPESGKRQGLKRYFWEAISISLSAQIAVLPISVFYFHQMPVYFLLTNVLVIPLAFGIVLTGLFFFLLHSVPVVSEILGGMLELLTLMVTAIADLLAALPGSTLEGLHIEPLTVFLGYFVILVLAYLIKTRQKIYLRLLMLALAAAIIFRVLVAWSSATRQLISVYHIPNHTAIDLVGGRRYGTIIDRWLVNDLATIEFKIQNFRRFLGLANRSFQIIITEQHPGFEIWKFNGKRVLLIKSMPENSPEGLALNFDIVVVINNSLSDFHRITSWIEAEYWVLDGSNKPWVSDKLESQAIEQGLQVHNCWKDGAFILTL